MAQFSLYPRRRFLLWTFRDFFFYFPKFCSLWAIRSLICHDVVWANYFESTMEYQCVLQDSYVLRTEYLLCVSIKSLWLAAIIRARSSSLCCFLRICFRNEIKTLWLTCFYTILFNMIQSYICSSLQLVVKLLLSSLLYQFVVQLYPRATIFEQCFSSRPLETATNSQKVRRSYFQCC